MILFVFAVCLLPFMSAGKGKGGHTIIVESGDNDREHHHPHLIPVPVPVPIHHHGHHYGHHGYAGKRSDSSDSNDSDMDSMFSFAPYSTSPLSFNPSLLSPFLSPPAQMSPSFYQMLYSFPPPPSASGSHRNAHRFDNRHLQMKNERYEPTSAKSSPMAASSSRSGAVLHPVFTPIDYPASLPPPTQSNSSPMWKFHPLSDLDIAWIKWPLFSFKRKLPHDTEWKLWLDKLKQPYVQMKRPSDLDTLHLVERRESLFLAEKSHSPSVGPIWWSNRRIYCHQDERAFSLHWSQAMQTAGWWNCDLFNDIASLSSNWDTRHTRW